MQYRQNKVRWSEEVKVITLYIGERLKTASTEEKQTAYIQSKENFMEFVPDKQQTL